MKKNYIYILLVFVAAFGCTTEDELIADREEFSPIIPPETVTGSSGTADFSNYVSFGASFAAGVMDGALYNDGQLYSYPQQIANQLMTEGIGGGSFEQPDINSVLGFTGVGADGTIFGRLTLDAAGPSIFPEPGGDAIGPYGGDVSMLNNFGVGGIILAQTLTPLTGGPASDANPAYNPFYARFASNPGVSTILGDALATNPTFFTSSLGGNDFLGYAVSGGDGSRAITSAADFQAQYTQLVQAMVATGAKGVLMNLPPVNLLPYFQAVQWDAIPLAGTEAAVLNTGLTAVNQAIQATALAGNTEDVSNRLISYADGANPVLVVDEELTDLGPFFDILLQAGQIDAASRASLVPYQQSRPLVEGELVLLPALAELGGDFDGDPNTTDLVGVVVPLGFNLDENGVPFTDGDRRFLDISEVTELVTAAATFTAIINGIVDQTNAAAGETVLAIADVYPIFADAAGLTPAQATQLAFTEAGIAAADGEIGLDFNGTTLAPDFSPNGIFSVDGIHPNPRGYGLMANAFIQTINENFGANIPSVDVLPLRTIYFVL